MKYALRRKDPQIYSSFRKNKKQKLVRDNIIPDTNTSKIRFFLNNFQGIQTFSDNNITIK